MMKNNSLHKIFPFLAWLKKYNLNFFSSDLLAGLTVGVMLIPQGMAYAMLAGVPPIYGLYSATIPLFVYAFLGSSMQVSVGPVAMASLLVSSTLFTLPQGTDWAAAAFLIAFWVGLFRLFFGWLRFGFVVNYISKPVISGYTSAAAIVIAFSQLKHLTGIPIHNQNNLVLLLKELFNKIGLIDFETTMLGVLSYLFIKLVSTLNKKYKKQFPAALLTVILFTLLLYTYHSNLPSIRYIGTIPSGLPQFNASFLFQSELTLFILPNALLIAWIGFMESIAVAKVLEEKNKNGLLQANQELIALGLSNLIGSFFGSIPVNGGFSRSAVNDQAGAKTPLAGVISALTIVVTLAYFTSYFYYLPLPILASIIIFAVIPLFEWKLFKKLYKKDSKESLIWLITFFITIWVGILQGLLAGVIFSFLYVLYQKGNLSIFKIKLQIIEEEQHVEIIIQEPVYFTQIPYLQKIIKSQNKKVQLSPKDQNVKLKLDFSTELELESLLNKKGYPQG